MNPTPVSSAVAADPELPPTGFAALVNSLINRLRGMRRRARPEAAGGLAEPPAAVAEVGDWEDPAFWLWMIH